MSDDVTVVLEDDHHLRRRGVRLSWSASDPLAVRVDVGGGTWVVLRDTLCAGLAQPTGIGQVRVGPAGPDVALTLRAAGRLLVVRLRTERLRAFLDQTEAVVPAGSEPWGESLDAALDALLGDAG